MYKTALKSNYLFDTVKGKVSVADLFQIPLTSKSGYDLTTIASNLTSKLSDKSSSPFEFIVPTELNTELQNKLEIVKDVAKDIVTAQQVAKLAKAKANKKAKLLEILARKQDESLESKSEAEILAELESLDN